MPSSTWQIFSFSTVFGTRRCASGQETSDDPLAPARNERISSTGNGAGIFYCRFFPHDWETTICLTVINAKGYTIWPWQNMNLLSANKAS